MEYKINFVNNSYRRFYALHKEELDAAWERCVSNGDLALRKDVWDLEETLANYIGPKYAVGLNSGTDALFLALKALGVGHGDEVVTVAHTFIASLQAIVHCGATPVLVDVNDDDELMNIEQLKKAITPRTKVIMPIHLTGKVCDMNSIIEIADEYGIHIVEDAAQALGATYYGRKAGSFGTFGCFSFNNAKLMGCYGDGGALVTNDEKLRERVSLLRNHWNMYQLSVNKEDYPKPAKVEWGWKSRLDNIQAAVLNVKFKYINTILNSRERIALTYNEAFKGLPLKTPVEQEGQVWQEYHVRVKDRADFVEHMKDRGIETLVRDEIPNHKQYDLGLDHFDLPVTERLAKEIVRLPSYGELADSEVEDVIEAVQSYYA